MELSIGPFISSFVARKASLQSSKLPPEIIACMIFVAIWFCSFVSEGSKVDDVVMMMVMMMRRRGRFLVLDIEEMTIEV